MIKSSLVLSLSSVLVNTVFAQLSVNTRQTVSEVGILAQNSQEFSKIVADLRATSSLAALGQGASLFVAVRNESPETIESMRVLFEISDGERVVSRLTLLDRLSFEPGATRLVAPDPLSSVASAMSNPPSGPSLGSFARHVPPSELDFFSNKTVTASVDSVSFASGRFAGPDTLNLFDRLVERDRVTRSFLDELAAMKGMLRADFRQVLNSRRNASSSAAHKTTGIHDLNLAAWAESSLCNAAMAQLDMNGPDGMLAWAEREKSKRALKPALYRR